MYTMIHETTLNALYNILKVNSIFRASKIRELGLKTNQGSFDRKLAVDPKISLTNPKDFFEKYDEVDGVYFRLLTEKTPVETKYGECVLAFSSIHFLVENNPFIINTEENNGFCIAEDGIVGESHFSGDEGLTITDLKNIDILKRYKFNPYASEVVIMDNIDLNFPLRIFVEKEQITSKLKVECHRRNIQLLSL